MQTMKRIHAELQPSQTPEEAKSQKPEAKSQKPKASKKKLPNKISLLYQSWVNNMRHLHETTNPLTQRSQRSDSPPSLGCGTVNC